MSLHSVAIARIADLAAHAESAPTVEAVDAIRATGDIASPVLGVGCALIAMNIAPNQMLVVALSLYVVATLIRYRKRRSSIVAETSSTTSSSAPSAS